MPIDPAAIESLQALALGFALAGLVATTFELFAERLGELYAAPGRRARGGRLRAARRLLRAVHHPPQYHPRPPPRAPADVVRHAGDDSLLCVWSLISGRLVLDVAQIISGA